MCYLAHNSVITKPQHEGDFGLSTIYLGLGDLNGI